MDTLDLSYATRCEIGNRAEQQDCLAVGKKDDLFLAVVCDGMGGLNSGSVASYVATEEMKKIFLETSKGNSIPDMLTNSVDILDEVVFTLVDENGKRLESGTTIVSVVIDGRNLYWMSVGDSRLYLFRNNEMVQATRDHNYSLYLESVKEEYAPTQSDLDNAQALISFIGMGGISVMDVSANPVELIKGDVLLVTSDGLYKALEDEKIQNLVSEDIDLETIADNLLVCAEEEMPDMRDNISFVLIRI